LINVDADEADPFGQQTRNTFYRSDVFVSLEHHEPELRRFLYLAFGCPTETPNQIEHSMYLAYAASLRSSDLSRQVGAALIDPYGDLLGVGCNDVPAYGGGLYWEGTGSARDVDYKIDANDAEKMDMALKIMKLINPSASEEERRRTARDTLRPTGFFDITEFGRAVHAEMDALLSCARTGRSPRGSSLYTTTFPCHNCTRHVIAAGITRVVYIEPYAKSKAFSLHQDAISNNENCGGTRLPFVPFIGIGPRRYLDLFSLSLGTGTPVERKRDGVLVDWNPAEAGPRLQMQPTSYLTRESFASASLKNILSSSQSIQ
jgi:deoxycytidylate deaminase